MDHEQRRWIEAVEAAEARLEQVDSVIHVPDQEADDDRTLFAMWASGDSFVVRIRADRNVCDGPRRTDFKELTDAPPNNPPEVDWLADARAVGLSARPKRRGGKGHPVRRASRQGGGGLAPAGPATYRSQPGEADARAVVNDVQLALLRSLKPKHFGTNPTAADALAAVAELGGHIRHNGPPGWLVLGRGWKHLRELEKGYRPALKGREKM